MELEKIGAFSPDRTKFNASFGRVAQWLLGEGEMKRHYATKETNSVGPLLLQHQETICDSAPLLSG